MAVALALGSSVGIGLGARVGLSVGMPVGVCVGLFDGVSVGFCVGAVVVPEHPLHAHFFGLNFEPNAFLAEYVFLPMWQLHHDVPKLVFDAGLPPEPELPTQRQ
jgi:hypothetical protein